MQQLDGCFQVVFRVLVELPILDLQLRPELVEEFEIAVLNDGTGDHLDFEQVGNEEDVLRIGKQ